jgi:hypothetical protein
MVKHVNTRRFAGGMAVGLANRRLASPTSFRSRCGSAGKPPAVFRLPGRSVCQRFTMDPGVRLANRRLASPTSTVCSGVPRPCRPCGMCATGESPVAPVPQLGRRASKRATPRRGRPPDGSSFRHRTRNKWRALRRCSVRPLALRQTYDRLPFDRLAHDLRRRISTPSPPRASRLIVAGSGIAVA